MIYATIIGNVADIQHYDNGRSRLRIRTRYRRYENGETNWFTLNVSAFMATERTSSFELGEPVTLIAEVSPDNYVTSDGLIYPRLVINRVLSIQRQCMWDFNAQEEVAEATVEPAPDPEPEPPPQPVRQVRQPVRTAARTATAAKPAANTATVPSQSANAAQPANTARPAPRTVNNGSRVTHADSRPAAQVRQVQRIEQEQVDEFDDPTYDPFAEDDE